MTRERWMLGAVAVLVVILVAVGTVLAVTGDDKKNVSVSATTTSSTSTSTLPATTTTSSPSTSVTIGTICTTPQEAAMSFIDAWIAGDQAAAARCASDAAVTMIFQNSGAGALYTFQGCSGDPGAPTCSYSYEGGGVNLSVSGTEATGWKVQTLNYIAD